MILKNVVPVLFFRNRTCIYYERVIFIKKLEVYNDLQNDKKEHMTIIKDSENNRTKLQVTITQTAEMTKEDRQKHEVYQQKLVNEINQLQQDIQDLHIKASERQKEHLDQLNRQD